MPFTYSPKILDHGLNLRNQGVLDPADADYETNNPLCGDNLRITLQIDERGCIQAVGWDVIGCAITQASASLLGEQIIGKSVDEVRQIDRQVLFDLLDVQLSLNRTNCALLPLKALTLALFGTSAWFDTDIEAEE